MSMPSPEDLAALRADVNAMLNGHLTAEVEAPEPRPERAEPEHAKDQDDGPGISGHPDASMNDQKGQGSSAPRRRRTTPPRSKASRATR
ncbi:hypothetical protein [Acidipropionibacterium acidipropionici]|uniref:hypothetical protein n=1 Tax=Acidipropionibacterium acidipropionici TaxID=1748 RepID=UPI000AB7A93B|nr:hypothetical protein [Acidipropionibacterium acidipropionici]